MSYQVKFTETTNPAKPAITVEDQRLNTEKSVTFVGKNYAGYAQVIAENFLHLLENFASNVSPANPVQGQLWFDANADVNLLKVWDGTQWTAAGSVKKASTQPSTGLKGDLWVNTETQQLYLYSGSNWILVGPQFSAGLKTGPTVETIVDTTNTTRSVITLWAENYRLAIISKSSFTPKQAVAGFTVIQQGFNLSTVDASSTTAPTKFWGIASTADALNVNGTTVGSSNFLRSDQTSTSNYGISIRNNGGITIGSDLSFNIGTDSSTNAAVFYSKTTGHSVDFVLNNAGTLSTVMHLRPAAGTTALPGIGINNSNPQEALDVTGSVQTSGKLIVNDTTDAALLNGPASIKTLGGLNVTKQSKFGDDITAYGQIYLNNLDSNDDPVAGSVLLPGSDDASLFYDIGSESRKFRNVWAEAFNGNFTGTFTGSLAGSITGSAAKLASPTAFSIAGDVSTTEPVEFNGQTETGTVVLNTTITQSIITGKTEITDSLNTDQLLIYRPTVGLVKSTKKTFVSNIPTVPPGAIFPFAGSLLPSGYLLCDGGEVKISDYPTLFEIIGYTYKAPSLLIGRSTFALPDLRGRFPLGRDDMDNGTTVPDKDDPTLLVDAGGGTANRVTDVTADVLGGAKGDEQRTVALSNLPDHQHTLSNGQADYFAVGRPGLTSDTNGVSPPGPSSTSAGLSVPNTGNVLASTLGQPIVTMNPYQTINYIIFTGTLQ